jgi:hypothetical protein
VEGIVRKEQEIFLTGAMGSKVERVRKSDVSSSLQAFAVYVVSVVEAARCN